MTCCQGRFFVSGTLSILLPAPTDFLPSIELNKLLSNPTRSGFLKKYKNYFEILKRFFTFTDQ